MFVLLSLLLCVLSVDGAININDRGALSQFFRTHSSHTDGERCSRLAVIFHCEFSQNRAPKSYKFFRSLDRLRNQQNYPHLSFPELCVLDGGYKLFHSQYPQHCRRSPLSDLNHSNLASTFDSAPNLSSTLYVSMWATEFQRECKSRTAAHRKSWGNCKLLPSDLKSPVRGQKRAASSSPSNDEKGTPMRSMSMPGGNGCTSNHGTPNVAAAGRLVMFSPMGAGLFASPTRSESMDSICPNLTARRTPTTLSPLPSFSLLSAHATPATPATPMNETLMSENNNLIMPVPFQMALCLSPEK